MPEFQTPADVGNRALQHLGQRPMNTALGLSEISEAASEINFCIGKLRQAELERNTWVFAIRRVILRAIDNNTMLLSPALFNASATYFRGSIVSDANNNLWISRIPNNTGNDPAVTNAWDPYFGPLTVSLYDSTQSYWTGELVYTTLGDGTYNVYQSQITGNTDNPATATAWDGTVTYFKNQVVTRNSTAYMSLIDLNLNQDPATAFVALWAVGTTYSAAQKVTGSDGVEYSSVGNGNIGHDPTTDGGVHWTNTGVLSPWSTSFVGGTGSVNWLQIGGAASPSGSALVTRNIEYPLGTGPSTESATANIFRLPANFLRKAPRDPKAGSNSVLGAPSGLIYDDWEYEHDYIVSREVGPIMVRFVADVVDVRKMHAMFCEGWAARIAFEICEKLTQSTAKQEVAEKAYDKAIGDARTQNAILVGSEEPPMDDWLACRY